MTIALIAATRNEISPLLDKFKLIEAVHSRLSRYRFNHSDILVLVTGVGMAATAFECGRFFPGYKLDMAINLGIAGSFTSALNKGDVVEVVSDSFADMGAEDGEDFLSLPQLDLLKENEFPFTGNQLVNKNRIKNKAIENLANVKSISVNRIHGDEKSIKKVIERHNPQTESMEGAAFFYCCFCLGIPCTQIRSISNYVEKRNRADWNIPLALKNLNETAFKILGEF